VNWIRDCYQNNRINFWKWMLEIYIAIAVTIILLIGELK
jgi:hypothetical protein